MNDFECALQTFDQIKYWHQAAEYMRECGECDGEAEMWRRELRNDELRGPGGAPVQVRREISGKRCTLTPS